MSEKIISVEDVSKIYRIGKQNIENETFFGMMTSILKKPFENYSRIKNLTSFDDVNKDNEDIIWALRNISFEVPKGEVIGIIGENGAGKSTLLKILAKITVPTSGNIKMKGRVASLLEVGTGFHPELTGRENIYLNGSILGMNKEEINSKLETIIEFSGIRKFIDTPIKRYSSGMGVRLAFSVAAHLEPEILLIDEVLAVGDVGFQKKCIGKMNQIASHGRTVLFVSHNMGAIKNLCTSVLLIKNGEIEYIGETDKGISKYLSSFLNVQKTLSNTENRIGSGEIIVESITVEDEEGNNIKSVISGSAIKFCLHFKKTIENDLNEIITSLSITNEMGVPIFNHHSRLSGYKFNKIPQEGTFYCSIPKVPLPASNYFISYSIMKDGKYIDKITSAISINVINGNFYKSSETPPSTHGVCLVDANWSI